MTYFKRLFGLGLNNADERLWGGTTVVSAAGIPVDDNAIMRISAAWACVRLISETIGSLPFAVFRRLTNNGRELARNHPLYGLLHDQPNERQTSIEFSEMMTANVLLRGVAYAEIKPGQRGFADQLVPYAHSDVRRVKTTTGTRYELHQDDGTWKPVLEDDLFILRGLSLNGKDCLSVIGWARESMGLTLAAERYGATYFANGARPSGVLTHPGKLKPQAKENLRTGWRAAHTGDNAHSLAVLEEGVKYEAIGMDNKDSQFLETREFQAEEVCRWFRVPPHMIGLTSKATSWGSGIEQMSIGFVTFTLMPWLVRWSQAVRRDLILAEDTYFAEHVLDALLRGDTKSRYDAYSVGRNGGWLSVNEIRAKENMNPIEDGDGYLKPLNMTDLGDETNVAPNNRRLGNNTEGAERLGLLLRSNAGRVARRELNALGKICDKHAEKSDDWNQAINSFYGEHADFVAEAMGCSPAVARGYADEQLSAFIEFGNNALAMTSEEGLVARLMQL